MLKTIKLSIIFYVALGLTHGNLANAADLSQQDFLKMAIPSDAAAQEKRQKVMGKPDAELQDYESQLSLAQTYAEVGLWPMVVQYSLKALELDSQKAAQEGAYAVAALGYYKQGLFKKCYDITSKAIEFNPTDAAAKALKEALEKEAVNGEIPEHAQINATPAGVNKESYDFVQQMLSNPEQLKTQEKK